MFSKFVVKLVVSIGREILERVNDPIMMKVVNKDRNTTLMDLHAHRRYVEGLNSICSGVPVLSEENTNNDLPVDGNFWIIDPIDGTSSWLNEFDGFVTQCALFLDHTVVWSMIYWPKKDVQWVYSVDEGCSFLNHRLGEISSRISLIDNYPEPRGLALRLIESIREIEPCEYHEKGSISLKMMHVCEGWSSLFCKDIKFRLWDVAPVIPFARAANVMILDKYLHPLSHDQLVYNDGLVVCSKHLNKDLLELVKDAFD